ncbi:putative PIG3 family NAD(P)H quinone oxidoreductase [Rhodopseudomonas julia]|uniref:PIG3 family NAD(P)H quinone oxidoreductase n=1 Tax=Rhodopseudomonas julia TaxID=200617 RepID=A0ABU0C680_9BRAD|nr:NAD(P)H-quinone oxidoreductase [Rhodopseudomonas julia]MDQ0326024.1 putative PIG3 family NAD(P)H quinone oxidoreductase [Rhodopseudomonas julia]
MNIPQTMEAVAITEPGGPEVLALEERAVPQPGEGELLVKVAAAGINRPDVLQRLGRYPVPKGASDIPGLEISGHVVAAGEGAERFSVGDAVVALLPGGGYAEYATVAETNALPLPQGLSLIEGAALPETTFTVWHNVFERGSLRPGETLLVHGGTSGIGTTAIQLAKAFNAHVLVTAGSDERCEAARRIGADRAINYNSEDFVEVVREFTGGEGADVILDMVGGSYTQRNLQAAAVDGRIVQIAFLKGQRAEVDLALIMQKRLILTGSTLRPQSVEAKAELARMLEETVWPAIAAGRYTPVIHAVVPFADVVEAHQMIDAEHVGKIVLKVDPRA